MMAVILINIGSSIIKDGDKILGGGTWVFLGWVCATRDSKLAPRSKKSFPLKRYPVLEMGQFFIPRSRIRPKTDTPF